MRFAAALLSLLLLAAPCWAQAVLDGVLQRGEVRVGLTGDYKPFSIREAGREGNAQFSGMDVDAAESLARSLGVKLVLVPTSWPTLMADLRDGKFDVGMGGISVTLDRAKAALFSTPVLRSGKAPIARCTDQDKFQTVADINKPGVRVIFNPGGTNERFARANAPDAALTLFPNNALIFDEIVAGRADVMMTDAVETRLQAKLHPELCAIHPDKPFDFAELAYLLPRDTVWQQYINQWLHLATETGERGKLVAKWLP